MDFWSTNGGTDEAADEFSAKIVNENQCRFRMLSQAGKFIDFAINDSKVFPPFPQLIALIYAILCNASAHLSQVSREKANLNKQKS